MKTNTPSSFASEGGKARAKSLTAEERSDIARAAVSERWRRAGKIVPKEARATHAGNLKIGDIELACAVLNDGTRVISERGLLSGLGITFGGASARGADNLPLFVAAKGLRPFIDNDLSVLLQSPIEYRPLHGGKAAHGLRAELIPKVCGVWLSARDAGVLLDSQLRVAAKADLLIRGLAEVGVVALVDEATGYQDDRDRQALAKILEAFVAKELKPWIHTFPADYYRQLYRLRGLEYPPTSNRMPRYFGGLTNDLVYARLAPGVLQELQRVTLRDEKGRLKSHLHRRLTTDVGHPKLLQHLGSTVALMKVSPDGDYGGFVKLMDKHYPRQTAAPLFDKPETGAVAQE